MEPEIWLEIARPGVFKDSGGREHVFTAQRLADMAAGYDPAQGEAPLVIGHPQTDGPAHGWIKSLKTQGGRLLANVAGLTDEIKEAVNNKRYRYLSMSLGPDGRLRHVGLLGAARPAISGLAPVEFAAGGLTINFSLDEEGQADGREEGPKMNLEELSTQIAELTAQVAALTQEREAARERISQLEKELSAARGESQKAAQEFAAYRDRREQELVSVRLERLVKAGRITPADLPAAQKTAEALRRAGVEFAEGRETPLEIYLASLENRPPSELLSNFSAPADNRAAAETCQPLSAKL